MNQAEELLKKYFDGNTSLKEEEWLRNYFRREKNIPQQLSSYAPLFNYFSIRINKSNSKKRKQSNKILFRIIPLGIAACILLFAGIHTVLQGKLFISSPTESLVYIDGVKYTSRDAIDLQALNALNNISEEDDEFINQIAILEDFFDE